MISLSAIWFAMLFGGPPTLRTEATSESFSGQVLPVAKALAKVGVKSDADAGGVTFVAADGKLYSLVKDETTRILLLDDAMQGRDLQLIARRIPGTSYLQVTQVRTLKNGVPHEVFYWCGQCQFRSNEPGPCKCCGGETVLTETPVKPK